VPVKGNEKSTRVKEKVGGHRLEVSGKLRLHRESGVPFNAVVRLLAEYLLIFALKFYNAKAREWWSSSMSFLTLVRLRCR